MEENQAELSGESVASSSRPQNVSLNAINHETNWTQALRRLYSEELFSDCTLVCPGGRINAHRVILAASSDYFANLLVKSKNCPSSTVFLNVNFYDLRAVIEFLYLGKVVVPIDCLPSLLDCARILMITQMFNSKISYETKEKQCFCKVQRSNSASGGKRKRVCRESRSSPTGPDSSSNCEKYPCKEEDASTSSSSAHPLSSDECATENEDGGLDLRVKDNCLELRKKRPVDLEPLEDGPKLTDNEEQEESCFKVFGDSILDGCIKQEPDQRPDVSFSDDGQMENLVGFPHNQSDTLRRWTRGNHLYDEHPMSGLTVPLSGSSSGSSYFWTEEETATLIRIWFEESERARDSGHRHLNIIRLQAALQSHNIFRTIDQIRRKIYKLKYAFREFENDGKVSAQISAHLKMLRTMDRQFILSD